MRTESPPVPAPIQAAVASARLVSVDALRGFDLFWILGAASLVGAFQGMRPNALTETLVGQLTHADWEGFTFFDLIFPLFVFLVGVSLVFSLSKIIANQGRSAALRRVLRRTLLLFALGLVANGGFLEPWPAIRLTGVLPRIALCYGLAALAFIFLRPRALAGLTVFLLIGYWALLAWVPIRDIRLDGESLPEQIGSADLGTAEAAYWQTEARVSGVYQPGYNLTNHLDFLYLPGRRYDVYWDPEGYLSTFPAVASTLLGIFAGLLLADTRFPPRRKVLVLVASGAGALALGYLASLGIPVIKKIWTSSYVLVAGGYSALLLGAFYYWVDIRQHRRWTKPFVWLGMNAITLYVLSQVISFRGLARRLVGGDVSSFVDRTLGAGAGELVIALVSLLLIVLLARFMYERRIFLKV